MELVQYLWADPTTIPGEGEISLLPLFSNPASIFLSLSMIWEKLSN
jgi:hypothetical protein